MKKVYSWHLPDYDTHYQHWMEHNQVQDYQKAQRDFCLEHVTQFRRAVDIGGNIGFWARDFCERFADVQIFEPDASNLECLRANLDGRDNHTIHEVGLSDQRGEVTFYVSPTTSGGHSMYRLNVHEDTVTEQTIQVHTLDSYELQDVDLIKIDTQGAEFNILKGAQETLTRESPILNIEIEHKTKLQRAQGRQIHDLLGTLGYREIGRQRKKEVVFAKR